MTNFASHLFSGDTDGDYILWSQVAHENSGLLFSNLLIPDELEKMRYEQESKGLMLRIKKDYGQAILKLAEK